MTLQVPERQPEHAHFQSGKGENRPGAKSGKSQRDSPAGGGSSENQTASQPGGEKMIGSCYPGLSRQGFCDKQGHDVPLAEIGLLPDPFGF